MRLCDSFVLEADDPDNRCPAGPLRDTADPDRLRCSRCAGWTPHGALPSRERVMLLTREIASLVGRLADDYAWAHSVAYAPRRRGPTNGNGKGPHGDPTGNTVSEARQIIVRDYTAIAARLLERAVHDLRIADEAAGEALLAAEPPGPAAHTKAAYHDTIPDNAPAYIVEAHAARARRRARGEGIPT